MKSYSTMRNLLACMAAIFLLVTAAQAKLVVLNSQIELGEVTASGTGCKSEDDTYLYHNAKTGRAVFFMWSHALELKDTNMARANCAAAVPITVARDRRIVMRVAHAKGEANLHSDSLLKVAAEVFLAGQSGLKINRSLHAEDLDQEGRYALSDTDEVVGECGQSGILRIQNSILLTGGGPAQAAAQTVSFTLTSEPCDEGSSVEIGD